MNCEGLSQLITGDNVARGFFRACGLYLVSSEEASVEEADKDL